MPSTTAPKKTAQDKPPAPAKEAEPKAPVIVLADGTETNDLALSPEDEQQVLFLYEPEGLGATKRGQLSDQMLVVPILSSVGEFSGKELPQFEQKGLYPGLQRISKKDADLIMSCDAKPIKQLIGRNVLRLWSETIELDEMEPWQAVESIRKTKSVVLLQYWAKRYADYDPLVQAELEQREENMKAEDQIKDQVKTVFGQRVA